MDAMHHGNKNFGTTDGRSSDSNRFLSPELQAFIDRVVVPALLERFLREHAADRSAADIPAA